MSRLALICAGGAFPIIVAKAANNPFLILLKEASPELTIYPHSHCGIAQIGHMINAAKANGCDKIAFVGSLIRPHLFSLIPDLFAIRQLPAVFKAYKGGDNHLLTAFAALFEKEGLKLIGAHEIAPALLSPQGLWGKHAPNNDDITDIHLAHRALNAVGEFDIGQGLVISNRHIIAIEGAEGTDGLLHRVTDMRDNGRVKWRGKQGIFVKSLKPNQDKRLDMPAVGLLTVENAIKAGLKGIAVEAQGALVLDLQAMIDLADKNGLFLYGFGETA